MTVSTSFFTVDQLDVTATESTARPFPEPSIQLSKMETTAKGSRQKSHQSNSDLPPPPSSATAYEHPSDSEDGRISSSTMLPPPAPSSDGVDRESVTGGGKSKTTSSSRKKKGTATVVKPPKRARSGPGNAKKSGGKRPGSSASSKAAVKNESANTVGDDDYEDDGYPGAEGSSGAGAGGGGGGGRSSESDSGPYCLCRGPDNHRFMIACDRCQDWFHGECIGMDKWTGEHLVQKYICPNCTDADRGYVTRYRKMCTLETCKNAARVTDPIRPSIFCSDEHCQEWWEQLVATLPTLCDGYDSDDDDGNHQTRGPSDPLLGPLMREDFLALLDSRPDRPDWNLFPPNSSKPFAVRKDFWENSPPEDVLTKEETKLLHQSAADRYELGEQIVLCKKMLELLDMGIERRERAVASGVGTAKDLCGYDVRLDKVGTVYQFSLWIQSDEGEAVFKSGQLDDLEGGEEAEKRFNCRSADGWSGGMCVRKKCLPHKQWVDILTRMVKHDIKQLAMEAKDKLVAEQRIRDTAASRYFRQKHEGNSVEDLRLKIEKTTATDKKDEVKTAAEENDGDDEMEDV
ncbi:hypothetical protein QBC35DRAFT_484069 [Podospora australis]|uniref:PHD-type domain-containing protein n=1 Tax=Podospora australis TaxID=1536484 RepID=A0AAN6X2P3_9PEZI|nr:hypothetical protein QBC35DRAFT_484069 [Podospora australis]